MRQEQVDSVTTYTLGGTAMVMPHYIEALTGVLQVLTIVFGFAVISLKLYFDIKKHFFTKKKDDDDDLTDIF